MAEIPGFYVETRFLGAEGGEAEEPAPDPPVLDSVSPDLIDTLGGTPFQLTGSNFTGATGVTVGGTACTSVVVVSDTQITCLTPAKTSGTYDVVVTSPGGSDTLAAAVEAWHPSAIADLSIYESTAGVTGDPVSDWVDQGRSYDLTQGTGANRPDLVANRFSSNSRPSLTFDGSNDSLSAAGLVDMATARSVFWVAKTIESTAADLVGGGSALMLTGYDTGRLRVYDADTATNFVTGTALAYNDGAPRVCGVTQNGVSGDLKFFVNGSQVGATQNAPFGNTRVKWQIVGDIGGNPFDGELAAICISETEITGTDLTKLNKWLYGKFVSRAYYTSRVVTSAPWIARDGAGLLVLGTDLYQLGGWNSEAGGQFDGGNNKDTNEVWKSTDGGLNWTEILAGDYTFPNATRWTPRHMAGWCVHDNYLYVIGSDQFNNSDGTYNNTASGLGTSDVWRSTDGVTWTRLTNAAPWGPRVLHMVGVLDGDIYVIGGQTGPSDPNSGLKDVWRSTDGGTNWTQLADAPWTERGMVCSPLPVFDGKLWVIGGGTYADNPLLRDYFSDVWSFDGTTWTEVLADGAAPWLKRQYHQTVVFDSKLWIINGWGDPASPANLNDVWSSPNGITWTQQTVIPWRISHADSVAVLSDRIVTAAGNGDIGQGSTAGIGKVHSIRRYGFSL